MDLNNVRQPLFLTPQQEWGEADGLENKRRNNRCNWTHQQNNSIHDIDLKKLKCVSV